MGRTKDVAGMKLTGNEASETALITHNNATVTGSIANTWGWLPILSLTSAVGIFLIALAAEAGRVGSSWADLLFWLGLLVLFLPTVVRIILPKPTRRERIALLVVLGSSLYLLRDLEQPIAFGYNDEFLHWRGALNIAMSGHLFVASPILPIGPFYPGLEIVTTALSSLTGFSIFVSGMIVLGVAGLVLVLALYLFYDYLSGSAQVAGIATLLYMATPDFFGDTQFVYEALAIPLTVFVLFAIVRRGYLPAGQRKGLTLAIWLGIAAVVITHHVTSYVLDAFLLLWTAAFFLPRIGAFFQHRRDWKGQASPGGVAFLGLVLSVAWLAYTGARAVGYLYPSLQATVTEFIQILKSEGTTRQLFHTSTGFVEPLWERVIAFAAVGLILLGLPFGLFHIWRRFRANAAILALAVGALFYPVSLAIRLTYAGETTGGRAQAYVFIMVAFVLALGITHFWLSRMPPWRYRVLLAGAVAIIFIGGWVTGTSPLWNRLPGPYLSYADQRSIQPESITAAEWANMYLGPGQRVITSDQYNMILMATYGDEWVVTNADNATRVSPVLTSPNFDSDVVAALRLSGIQYIVVDHRIIGLEETGYAQPLDSAMLAKFDSVQNVSRIFDSGNIVIYDVVALTTGKSPPPVASPCTPASATGISGSYPSIAKLYDGVIYDIPTSSKTNISLTGIQQRQGSICGYFNGMPVNGLFTGTITTNGHIQFTIPGSTGQTIYSFDGQLTPGGVMVGSYCGSRVGTRQCTSYGLWSITPGQAG